MEHYCEEHGVKFFKTAKMKTYAHTIEGTEPTEWCNEQEGGAIPAPSSEMSKKDWSDKDQAKRDSIEAQNAYTGVVQMMVSGVLVDTNGLFQSAMNYAASKLGKWASQGVVESKSVEGLATTDQLKRIFATAKEKKYDTTEATAIMMRLYDTPSSKKLTKKQADEFIQVMVDGKYKDDTIEPEDLPF